MSIFSKKNIDNAKRINEIFIVLSKHGLGYFFDMAKLSLKERRLLKTTKRKKDYYNDNQLAMHLRQSITELGPTYIKFGQILSMRPDFVPAVFVNEFSKLQDKAPVFSYSKVSEIFADSQNKKPEKIFKSFNKKPVAAASLSQVHKAVLYKNKNVAVKVQRPDIEKEIKKDIDLLRYLSEYLEDRNLYKTIYSPKEIIKEFETTIYDEIDFNLEADNIERFANSFEDEDSIVIPQVYREFSNKKIIVMDFIDGVKIEKVQKSRSKNYNKNKIVSAIVNMVLKQIFDDGFFHADLHKGNLLILPGNKIAMLDFGMVGNLTAKDQDNLSELLIAIIQEDVDLIIEVFDDMGVLTSNENLNQLSKDLQQLFKKYYGITFGEINMSKILYDVVGIMNNHKLKFPSHMILLMRTLVMVETLCAELDPKFNIFDYIKPYVKRLIRRRYTLERLVKKGYMVFHHTLHFMEILPEELTLLIKKIRSGNLHVDFEHKGLERLIEEVDRSSDDVALAVVIAGITIGSSLVLILDKGPYLYGYPVLGILGYVAATLGGLWLMLRLIFKSRK